MILPIYIYGHDVLRKKCLQMKPDYPNLDNLIQNMFKTMKNANGIGLSAPQIGLSVSMFIIDLTYYSAEDPTVPPVKEVFINPEIISEYGEITTHNEGCLSIPDVRGDVQRPSELDVRYFDENFNEERKKINGLFARVFQHEFDHLNKKLFIDHLSSMKKNMLNKKLNLIARGKFNKSYPVKIK